jgi:outer membrane cobalamin receptor
MRPHKLNARGRVPSEDPGAAARSCGLLILALTFSLGGSAASARDGNHTPYAEDPYAGVEEVRVWGIQTGHLTEVPSASTDHLRVDDFTAESKRLADLLQESAGVSVRRFGGPGDPVEVSIRGSTANQVVVTLDGIRTNSVLTGGLDLSNYCLPLVHEIEITRGAGSIQEGSGAVGGTVNLVSRAGAARGTTRARLEAGAFDTVDASILHADHAGDLDYALGYCGLSTEGDFEFQRPVIRSDGFETRFQPDTAKRINNDREQHGANLGLGWQVGPGVLRLLDVAGYASSGEPGVDAGNGVLAGQRTEARSRNTSNLAQLRWEGPSPSGQGDDFSIAAYHRYERNAFRDPADLFGDSIDVKTRLESMGLRSRDTWRHTIAGHELTTRLAFDAVHDRLRSTDRSGRERPMLGGSVNERLALFSNRVQVETGLRVDWTDGFDPQLLPAFGVVIEPLDWLRLRGQAGRAYRAPGFDELYLPDQGFLRGNPDLSPEDAWNVDGGLELALAELGPLSDLRIGATGFHRTIDESIVWVRINLQTIAPVNTGSATSRGLELEARFDVGPWIGVAANYTWTDSERDDNGARLAGQAEHEAFARLRLGPEKIFKLVFELQYLSGMLVDEGGSLELPARQVWNTSAAVDLAALELEWLPVGRVARELWIYAALDNIGDEAVRDVASFPQPGRNGRAGFEVRW